MTKRALSDSTVTEIRTAGKTGTHWSRELGIHVKTIADARRGVTYQHVATSPDLAARRGTGRGLKADALPARVRRSYFRGC
jgi:hypothetical protein